MLWGFVLGFFFNGITHKLFPIAKYMKCSLSPRCMAGVVLLDFSKVVLCLQGISTVETCIYDPLIQQIG